MSNDGTLNQRESGSGVLDAPLQSKEPAGWAGRNLQTAQESGTKTISTDKSINSEGGNIQVNYGNVGNQDNRGMFAQSDIEAGNEGFDYFDESRQQAADEAVQQQQAENDAIAQQKSSITVGDSIEEQLEAE